MSPAAQVASLQKPLGESTGNPMILPPDHPHTRKGHAEGGGAKIHSRKPSSKSFDTSHAADEDRTGHRRTRSSKNLISLLDREKIKPRKKTSDNEDEAKLQKSKSSTGLASMFSRPGSSKGTRECVPAEIKDKENQAPLETPIWKQFATRNMQDEAGTTKVPLNDRDGVQDEIDLYMPRDYSPSKQRNYSPNEQPTLSKRPQQRPRPKSENLQGSRTQKSLSETLSGPRSFRPSQDLTRRDPKKEDPSTSDMRGRDRKAHDEAHAHKTENEGLTISKRGSRVMAAVAAFNGKSKGLPKDAIQQPTAQVLDPHEVERAFETLLESRNVPQNTRDKMRSLDTNIKADFINKDKTGPGSASSTEGLVMQSRRPTFGKRSKTDDGVCDDDANGPDSCCSADAARKSRPRSRTFTFNKGEGSPTKKHKSDRSVSRHRAKSGQLQASESAKTLSSTESSRKGSFGLFGKANVFLTPADCIAYLRKVQQPQELEVGRIQKLKQLLRNETVEWVNTFIKDGGMMETIGLLYRIIAVEWREEHEDTLLHETLSCLKALSTTSLALASLTEIHDVLFRALLGLLYSEEKKGPSEFATRTLIVGLLSTYLSNAPKPDIETRSRTVLSYLRDPAKPEAAQVPGFISTMHHPRPYRVWQKEISDVTKEVFWIFLHNVNIIPYPDMPEEKFQASYISRHYPQPHPPIPTAPYIGGVEWDATTYLTTHLDLLNGILASLSTRGDRNSLRQEMKDSGFEKVMGATLRTCKEKFYGSVHAALSTWVGAAKEDGWDVKGVREGALPQTAPNSPRKSSPVKKGKIEAPPKLEMPKLDFGVGGAQKPDDGGWL